MAQDEIDATGLASYLGSHVAGFRGPIVLARLKGGKSNLSGDGEHDPGIPTTDTYIQDYCALTSRGSIPHIDVDLAYDFSPIAAILQGIAGRVRFALRAGA